MSNHAPDFDLVLQVTGVVRPYPFPYALYIDTTQVVVARAWPAWALSPVRQRVEREMCRHAQHVFVFSNHVVPSLVQDYQVDPQRISVVGAGVNLEVLPVLRRPQDDIRLLFVGKDFRRKGGAFLLEAYRKVRSQHPNVTLSIVGTTDVPPSEGVTVIGLLRRRRDLEDLYRRASVFCLPSLYEPWGHVLTEAMAFGLPCVATNVGGIPDIVDHGHTGLLVPPSDSDALAAALALLIEDPSLAIRMGAAGRLRVERQFTWAHVAERMTNVVGSVGQVNGG